VEGPWSEPRRLNVGEIDPGHVVGPDGKRYLHVSGGHAVDLADNGIAVAGELKKVYDGWPIPDAWRVECFCLESPKLLFRDGWYHLFSAQGGTGGPSTSHMVVEARSRSPIGPWENSPLNPVIHNNSPTNRWWSRGHGTVFEASPGSWWIVYHAYDRDHLSLGRQTLMEPVEWTSSGWARVPARLNPAGPLTAPALTAAPLPPLERSDEFAGPSLGMQWQFWDEFNPGRIQFQSNSLVMIGKGTSPADCGPMACMPGDNAYEVTVELQVQTEALAGLILFYNPRSYVGLGITKDALWAGERGELKRLSSPEASPNIWLRLVNDHGEVDFLAGPRPDALRKVYSSINVRGYSHHTFGGFLSLRPALFCAGRAQAVFRHFRYSPLQ